MLKNQSEYRVLYARLKSDINSFCFLSLKKGNEYPVKYMEIEPSLYSTSLNIDDDVLIQVFDEYFNNIIPVNKHDIELFVKTLIPKFNIGDKVTRSDVKQDIPFNIAEYTLSQGRIWYWDEWSVRTGCASGAYEECLAKIDYSLQTDNDMTQKRLEEMLEKIGGILKIPVTYEEAIDKNQPYYLGLDYEKYYGGYKIIKTNMNNRGTSSAFDFSENRISAKEMGIRLEGMLVGLSLNKK